MNALQLVVEFKDGPNALEAKAAILLQDGILGARVLPAGGGKPIRLQAIFGDAPDAGWYPDGVRRVTLPTNFLRSFDRSA